MKLASTAINHLVLWISFWAIECCWRRILHLIINLLYNFSSYHGEKIIERLNRGLNRRCVICQRWNDWLSDIYERRSINRQNCRWNLDGTAHWLMLIFAFTVCSMWSCGNVHWSDSSRVRHSSETSQKHKNSTPVPQLFLSAFKNMNNKNVNSSSLSVFFIPARNKLNIFALVIIVISINKRQPPPMWFTLINSQRAAGSKRVGLELYWRSLTLQGIAKRSFWPSQTLPSVTALIDARRVICLFTTELYFSFLLHDNFLVIENNWNPSIFPQLRSISGEKEKNREFWHEIVANFVCDSFPA